MKYNKINNKGDFTLLTVLIVAAIGVATCMASVLLGIAASQTSFEVVQSLQARYLADACIEDALENIKNNSTYTSNNISITISTGACTYSVASTGSSTDTITSTGLVNTITRKVIVNLSQKSPVQVSNWQEVAN